MRPAPITLIVSKLFYCISMVIVATVITTILWLLICSVLDGKKLVLSVDCSQYVTYFNVGSYLHAGIAPISAT